MATRPRLACARICSHTVRARILNDSSDAGRQVPVPEEPDSPPIIKLRNGQRRQILPQIRGDCLDVSRQFQQAAYGADVPRH